MTDTLTLPSTISVDPSTGNVLVSSSEPITNMTIVVYAYLPNYQSTSFEFKIVGDV